MSISIRYFITDPNGNLIDWYNRTGVAALDILGRQAKVFGSSEADRVYVQAGTSADLTELNGGNDRIYLSGLMSEYSQAIDADTGVYTFTRLAGLAQGQSEVVRLTVGAEDDVLYFTDGHISLNGATNPDIYDMDTGVYKTIIQQALQEGGTPLTPPEIGTDTTSSAPVNVFVEDPLGISVPQAPQIGQTLKVYGSGEADSVYVRQGTSADVTELSGGNDRVYLTGRLVDYTQSIDQNTGVYTLTRTAGLEAGHLEVVTLTVGADDDVLHFADGCITLNGATNPAIFDADTGEFKLITPAALQTESTPGLTDIDSIAIDTGNSTVGAGGMLKAGDAIVFTVTMKTAVDVVSTGGLLRLKVMLDSGVTAWAQYDSTLTGGNTNKTVLKFKYKVGVGDTDINGVSVAKGDSLTSALDLNSGTINKAGTATAAKLTQSPALAEQASHKVDGTVPTITTITSDKANGSYKASDHMGLSMAVSEDMPSGATVTVTLETGTTDQQITLTRDATNAKLFIGSYVVQMGDTSSDLMVTAVALGTGAAEPTDAAGNPLSTALPTGANSLDGSKALVIDTLIPDAPLIDALQTDTGSSDADYITSNGTVLLSGLELGARLEYSIDGGKSWTQHDMLNGATTGSIILNPSFYSQSILIRQVDAAGNRSLIGSFDNPAVWQARLNGDLGAFTDDQSQVVALTNGGFVVVWRANKSTATSDCDIWVQGFDALGCRQGAAQLLGTAASAYADETPRITALADGAYAVAWSGKTSDAGMDIFVQGFDANHAKIGQTHRLTGMAGVLDDTGVQIVDRPGGGYVLSWVGESNDSHGRDVFVQVADSHNALSGDVLRLRGANEGFTDDQPQVTALESGGFVVVWRSYKSGNTYDRDVMVQRFNAVGTPQGTAYRLGDSQAWYEDDAPEVTALPDGGYVVVWQGYLDDFEVNIFAQRFDSNGLAIGPQHTWQGGTDAVNDYAPQVCALAGGAYVVAWYGETSDAQGTDVFWQAVNGSHQTAGSVQRLQGVAGNRADSAVQIVALTGGGFVLAWEGETSDGSSKDIFVQAYSSSGLAYGDQHRLQGSAGNLADTLPQIDALADGGYVVTWTGETSDGQGADVFVQRFDAASLPCTQGITVDIQAPVVQAVELDGATLRVTYDALLAPAALPDADQLTVLVGGVTASIASIAAHDHTLILQLAQSVGYGHTVTLSYADSTPGDDDVAIQDVAGNDAAGVTTMSVTNLTVFSAPQLRLLNDAGSSDKDGVTNQAVVQVSGLALNATWQYSFDGGTNWTTGTGTSFMLQASSSPYDVRVQQTQGQTTSSASANWSVTVDTTAPAAAVIAGFDKFGLTTDGVTASSLSEVVGTKMTDLSGGASALLEGSSESFAQITLSIGGESRVISANAAGYWSYRLTEADFANVGVGSETIMVSAVTDLAGNTNTTLVSREVTFNALADTQSHKESDWGSDYVDALVCGGAGWHGKTLTYSFALGSTGVDWTESEKTDMRKAFQAYANVSDLKFVEGIYHADDYMSTSIELRKEPGSVFPEADVLADFQLPTDNFNGQNGPVSGRFDYEESSWAVRSDGSLGYYVLLHEIGHGLGLAHPFDDIPKFPGVVDTYDKGTYNLNQGIWTLMSYNFDWANSPADSSGNWGMSKTPMSFDIAAIQAMYGANTSFRTGDDSYVLPTQATEETGWECIWDAGGGDTISNEGSTISCIINLNAYPITGGVRSEGYVSYNNGEDIPGGFTIADGAIIENAIGGGGTDQLIGNQVANQLTGGAGLDFFMFNAALGNGNIDSILDFSVADADRLVLSKAVFSAFALSTSVGAGNLRSGSGLTTAADGDDYLIYNSTTGHLYYDRDGSGSLYASTHFAVLETLPAQLLHGQFILMA